MNANLEKAVALFGEVADLASSWRRFFFNASDEEINNVISQLAPLDLVSLDHAARSSAAEYVGRWRKLDPAHVPNLSESRYGARLLGLASFHPNGYVRQAAVSELAKRDSGTEVPYLLLRLNDWVKDVRKLSLDAIETRLTPEYARHFLENISLVFHLQSCGRVDSRLIKRIFEMLKSLQQEELLRVAMYSREASTRRAILKLASEIFPARRVPILRAVLNDSDAVTRTVIVHAILPLVSVEELSAVAEELLKDRHMPVRRETLVQLGQKRPDLAAAPMRAALLDEKYGMRELAVYFRSVAGIENARDFYVQVLERGPEEDRYAAICGVGENGAPEDADKVAPFLNASRKKIRWAAVRALGRLDAPRYFPTFIGLLADVSPKISREALKWLMTKPALIPFEEIERLSMEGGTLHVRRNALALSQHAAKWQKLPVLLKLTDDKDQVIAATAKSGVANWIRNYNRSFDTPTRDDCEKITAALTAVESKLGNNIVKHIKYCLGIHFR